MNVSCSFVGFTNHRHFSIQIVKVRIVMGKLIMGHNGQLQSNFKFSCELVFHMTNSHTSMNNCMANLW